MFRGATKVTLDAKGRLAIPTRYRERIAERCANQLVVTVDQDNCLLLYPLPAWEDIERKLERLPSFTKKTRELQRMMIGYATEVELDGHGRILLPKELREFANIERVAMLVGQGRKFELWDEAMWSARRDSWLADEGDESQMPAELESLSL